MRLLNLCCSYFTALIILSACGREENVRTTSELSKTYLNINLDKNIRSLIPSSNGNKSEKFLYKQLYEPLISQNDDDKPVNQLIDQISVDSAINKYTFSLKNDHKFSDGEQLTTKDIRKCFLRLFTNSSINENILSFKRNIIGYDDFERSKLSGGQQEILPSGITFINNFTFSLTTKIIDPDILKKLSIEAFYIFKLLDSGNTLGTGPFAIDYSNDDINVTLKRNPYYKSNNTKNLISGINIRFIKNKDALIDEFLNESIDVIYYSASRQDIPYLDTLLSQKYSFKNYIEQDSATLQYLTFHNFTNTNIIDLLMGELALDSTLTIYSKKLIVEPKKDSSHSFYEFPLINKTNKDHSQLIDYVNTRPGGKLRLSFKETSEVNLNESYLVINESHLKMTTIKPEKNTLKLLLSNSPEEVSALSVLKHQNDMIIFNENLNGFTQFGHWSYDIKKLTFSQPKVF